MKFQVKSMNTNIYSNPKNIISSLLVLLISCTNDDLKIIPTIEQVNISIDGIFNSESWDKSRIIEITPTNSLYLIQDKNFLFLGIKNKEDVGRYVDIYLNNNSIGTINLHASMQLGERKLNSNWNDTIPSWNWGNNLNWTANVVKVINQRKQESFLESVEDYQGFEFKIEKKILRKESKIRIEIKDFMGEANRIVFPSNSVRLNTKKWFLLKLK